MTSNEIDKLWSQLEEKGLEEVRKLRAQGVYGERKIPLVDEWIRVAEKKGGLVVPDDEKRSALYAELETMEMEKFRNRIAKEKDNDMLGYLRYDFHWNPDPRKSTWQAIEINRLLTKRKESRLLRPTWYGVAVAILLGIASLIVAVFKSCVPAA